MTNYIGDWLLDIVSISTNRSMDEFDREQIEAIANSIVSLRGVINPLIVRKTGYNADGEELYELLDGHLQFFAAQRAMEIDPKLEMIRAFVVDQEHSALFQRQVDLLRSANSAHPQTKPVTPPATKVSIDYERLSNEMEQKLNSNLGGLISAIKGELASFKTEIMSLLTAKTTVKPKTSKPRLELTSEQQAIAKSFVEAVNQLPEAKLTEKLKNMPNSTKFLSNLLQHRPFQDIEDMVKRTPHFKEKTCKAVLQNWHG